MTDLDVEQIRKDFPIFDRQINGQRIVYLDSAASSQKPRVVIETMDRFYETSYAPTHRTRWSAGGVGAPLSDWRDYDSVYTERLMKLPKNNPDGYRRTAPRFAADRLHGRMLLIHGTMDDNVHMQNSVQFAYELQKAGKPFEMMVYAKQRHGFSDPALIKHQHQLELDFVLRAAGVPASGTN